MSSGPITTCVYAMRCKPEQRVFSTTYDSPSIPPIVSKWRLLSFIFHRRNRVTKNPLLEKEMSWRNSQYFCSRSSWRSLHIFSCSLRKAWQHIRDWLFWTAWKNSLWKFHFISKKMLRMLLNFIFNCLAYFGLLCTEHSCTAHVSPPRTTV
jgi:hypothetical protein